MYRRGHAARDWRAVELLEADDAQTRDLYAAARSETPIRVMFQLGKRRGN